MTLADPDADAAALREMGERVVAECVRQERLIEALLELVRGERVPARREPVDLAAVAAMALRAHDLRGLERVVALAPARADVDPELVERLAANLVSNAILHNVARGRIEVATRTEAGRAHLSVVNTGPSIPAGEVRRLLRPFERRGPAGGAGLGLAVVQAIAAAHDATVALRARPGGGLAVDVAFPAGREVARCVRASGPPDHAGTGEPTPQQPARDRV